MLSQANSGSERALTGARLQCVGARSLESVSLGCAGGVFRAGRRIAALGAQQRSTRASRLGLLGSGRRGMPQPRIPSHPLIDTAFNSRQRGSNKRKSGWDRWTHRSQPSLSIGKSVRSHHRVAQPNFFWGSDGMRCIHTTLPPISRSQNGTHRWMARMSQAKRHLLYVLARDGFQRW